MAVFGMYARYYDEFYRDKDYEGECRFLEQVLDAHGHRPVRCVLDLGCGTGGHALVLSRMGYEVVGVDRSRAMRFFFLPEVESLLQAAGLRLVEVSPFLRLGEPPTESDSNVSFVARAV